MNVESLKPPLNSDAAGLDAIFARRFVINAGKGGVGRSTVTAAMALLAAQRGKRVLVIELGSQERVPGLLGFAGKVGYAPTQVREGIEVINVTPGPALHEYGLMKLKFERIYKIVFENPVMRSLTRMIPGMNELVLIGKAWFLEQERDTFGRPLWDLLLVDAPATGHGVSLLDLPHVITESVKSGPLADEVGAIKAMLVDERRTCMNIVTLPEEMPVRETLDLHRKMRETLHIAPGLLVLNGVYPELPSGEVVAATERLSRLPGPTQGLAQAAAFLHERRRVQDTHRALLREHCDLPMISLPYIFTSEFGPAAVAALAAAILTAPIERAT